MPRVGLVLHPMVVETYGNWGKQAHDTFPGWHSSLDLPKSAVVAEMYGRLNMVLVRSIARAILARELPPSKLLLACILGSVSFLIIIR